VAEVNVVQHPDLIAINPNIRGGRPFVIGATVTVADIAVAKIYQMLDADEIADWFELSLPQVYAALAYYYAYKGEIDQSIADRRQLAADLKEKRVGSRHQPLFG
jgi:uncharacterized protein (DUF433 family)